MKKKNTALILRLLLLFTIFLSPAFLHAGAAFHTVTVQTDASMLAWGNNTFGQLGDSTTIDRANPVPVTDNTGTKITGIMAVATGQFHTLALKSDGTLLAWGNNEYGQLGDGTQINRSNAVAVKDGQGITITGITAIAAGIYHNIALKSDGTLLAWGSNWAGQLGDGSKTMRLNPVVVSNASAIIAIAAGDAHSLALKNDGSLLAWGNNGSGQLGDGSTINRSTPVSVSNTDGTSLGQITAITAGGSHNLALLRDGSIKAWGYNGFGQLGDGTTSSQSNPVTVIDSSGLTIQNIIAISAGQTHSVALKNDATVLAWGHNFYGQLGTGNTTATSIPSAIVDNAGTPISAIAAVATGLMHTLLIKNDGSLMSCGSDQYGQLGFGSSVNQSNPVAVKYSNGNTLTAVHSLMGITTAGDSTAPLVTPPSADIYVLATDVNGTAATHATIAAFLSFASAVDTVDGSITVTHNAPTIFPVGTTAVTFTATDTAGNTGTATASVVISQSAQFYPASGSALSSAAQRFAWTDTGAKGYYLMISDAAVGGNNVYNSGFLAAGTSSVLVTGLPTNGSTLYVRHFTWNGSAWNTIDYTFTASAMVATIVSPINGSTLSSTSQQFSWADTGAGGYYLMVGSAVLGGNDLYTSGFITAGTTSVTINGLPNNGKTVYVRLYSWVNGGWQTTDSQYVASGTAILASPSNGTILASAGTQTFSWVNSAAQGYYLSVGRTLGQADLFQSGWMTGTTVDVSTIPAGKAMPLFVRLYSWSKSSGWQVNVSHITSSYATTLTNPIAGSTLTGTTQTFTWNDTGAIAYYLDIGSGFYGHGDYFKSGNITGPANSIQVTGLPTGSVPLYVRLYTWGANGWNTYEAMYTSAP